MTLQVLNSGPNTPTSHYEHTNGTHVLASFPGSNRVEHSTMNALRRAAKQAENDQIEWRSLLLLVCSYGRRIRQKCYNGIPEPLQKVSDTAEYISSLPIRTVRYCLSVADTVACMLPGLRCIVVSLKNAIYKRRFTAQLAEYLAGRMTLEELLADTDVMLLGGGYVENVFSEQHLIEEQSCRRLAILFHNETTEETVQNEHDLDRLYALLRQHERTLDDLSNDRLILQQSISALLCYLNSSINDPQLASFSSSPLAGKACVNEWADSAYPTVHSHFSHDVLASELQQRINDLQMEISDLKELVEAQERVIQVKDDEIVRLNLQATS